MDNKTSENFFLTSWRKFFKFSLQKFTSSFLL